jgi:hypothetical protein
VMAGPALGQPRPELIPEERERRDLMIATPVGVLAVDDARLVRMQLQTDLRQASSDRVPHPQGLGPAAAVHHRVIAVALEPEVRVLPGHPGVERVVGSPRGISPLGSHRTERDSLPSFRSSHPAHENARIHAHCANRSGCRWTSLSHHTLQRLKTRSRLNFLRAHRIR